LRTPFLRDACHVDHLVRGLGWSPVLLFLLWLLFFRLLEGTPMHICLVLAWHSSATYMICSLMACSRRKPLDVHH
jgi:hypothetical protein